jgi:hypothetical protein
VARLYDINGAASNTIENENIEWQWSLMTGSKDDENNNLNNNNIFRIVGTNGNKCTITAYSDINLASNFTILKVVCTISGSKIIAYKPIAIKTKVSNELSRCDTISGDPIITYNTLGKPIYNSSTY